MKKILDKKDFIYFIIMVTWLVVLGGKIKGKGFPSLPLSLSVKLSLSFALAESLSGL